MRVGLLFVFCVLFLCFAAGKRKKKHTLLTYNTALLDILGLYTLGPGVAVPSRTERRNAIIEQLNKTSADVACLQEVWFGEDMDIIIDELEHKYPHTFSALHDATGQIIMDGLDAQPACPNAVFTPFWNCFTTNCTDVTTIEEVIGCISASCGPLFVALPQDCWGCFLTTGRDFAELILKCTDTAPGPYRKMNEAGLLLLSRREMRNQTYVDLHPGTREVLPKGYIEAEVRGMGQIVCVHTTDYDAGAYYEFELQAVEGFTSLLEQGKDELTKLVERFSDKDKLFLLGDVNTGPGFPPDVIAEEPGQFAILADVFNVKPIRQCTFCSSPENAYNGVREPHVLEHIFYKGYKPLVLIKLRIEL